MVLFDVSYKPRGNAKTKAYVILVREKPMKKYLLSCANCFKLFFHNLGKKRQKMFMKMSISELIHFL